MVNELFVELFFEYGVDVDVVDVKGMMVLGRVWSGRVVEVLLVYGVDIKVRDKVGRIVLC